MSERDLHAWNRILRGETGFTIMEIVFVVLLLGAMVAIAIPAFSNWLPAYHLKAACQDLFGSLQLAKATAMGKGVNCTVSFNQPVNDQTFDYVVFLDTDGDLEYDLGETILVKRSWGKDNFPGIWFDPSHGGGDGLTFSNNDKGIPAISFQASGIPISNSGGLGMGTAYVTNSKGMVAKVVVSCSGNIRVE